MAREISQFGHNPLYRLVFDRKHYLLCEFARLGRESEKPRADLVRYMYVKKPSRHA